MGQVLKGIAVAIGQSLAHGVVVPGLIEFLNASPTAFHAVDEAKKRLVAAGYEQVLEREDWILEVGKKYFFTWNYSSIIAFAIGKKYVAGNGFHIIGAHTDSPCLKLKPVSKVTKGGYLEVGVQTHGGGLWRTWFDRDLTVAGRVIIREAKNGSGSVSYSHRLVRIKEPIMRIPTLAIHLDRGYNDEFMFNTENHLLPVLATSIKAEINKNGAADGSGNSSGQTNGKNGNERTTTNSSKHHSLLLQLLANQIGCEPDDICDFELQACDTQPSIIAGARKEFIFSGRLDNLCMSFCSLMALIASSSESSLEDETGVRMVALFDHEEAGSNSAQGAGSPLLINDMSRITNSFDPASKALIASSSESSLEDETGVRVVALFDHEEAGSNSAQGAGSPLLINDMSRITNSFDPASKALIASSSESSLEDETGVRMVALFDHEEAGSNSAQGAGSPLLINDMSRITNSFDPASKALIASSSESSLEDEDEDETGVGMVALFDHEEAGSNSAQGAGSPLLINAMSRITNSFDPASKALIDSTSSESSLEDETGVRLVALFDHEEVGSNSAQGAGSPVMLDSLSRITDSFGPDSKLLEKAIQRSFLVSADMAHALHPNYMDKHEDNHQPKMHGGLVIKHNANQRYATNAVTSFIFKEIAAKHNLPVQEFVVRNYMPCGPTIGPILASGVGIRTVDVGAPQLSMHSIREMCAIDDVMHSYEHFKAYFQEFSHLDAKMTVDV
ncbi:probable aspartyl aminopeptidase isoform X1 [Juglans regia]|uniref:Probable aspartyl aminopeptidase isoform X1 n=1 Tax=Juglans regia TaxID=51240 RepID=A0A6P9E515_JUGRE|nr:probable aspartyl aminopeptidase isoform X1 [Juglans regia]